ncbi:hypothetical protein GCM10023093_29760 [Nemorincola caseinilytica]|uniref:Lipoprotein n=1 Tax=Nemorincola caseinilytica TaxID=2054315 RepID=A0ABP8NQK5_9BACT
MKRSFAITAILLSGILYLASCNKGDDNPYKNWKCTCFVTQFYYIDTVKKTFFDTVTLKADNMDKNSATSFCTSAQTGYLDTFGSFAKCTLK